LLTAVGRYRAQYSLIEQMASRLAPLAMQYDLLPLIRPIRSADFAGMTANTRFVRQLTNDSRMLYWAEAAQ
jgi:hypothetical protein